MARGRAKKSMPGRTTVGGRLLMRSRSATQRKFAFDLPDHLQPKKVSKRNIPVASDADFMPSESDASSTTSALSKRAPENSRPLIRKRMPTQRNFAFSLPDHLQQVQKKKTPPKLVGEVREVSSEEISTMRSSRLLTSLSLSGEVEFEKENTSPARQRNSVGVLASAKISSALKNKQEENVLSNYLTRSSSKGLDNLETPSLPEKKVVAVRKLASRFSSPSIRSPASNDKSGILQQVHPVPAAEKSKRRSSSRTKSAKRSTQSKDKHHVQQSREADEFFLEGSDNDVVPESGGSAANSNTEINFVEEPVNEIDLIRSEVSQMITNSQHSLDHCDVDPETSRSTNATAAVSEGESRSPASKRRDNTVEKHERVSTRSTANMSVASAHPRFAQQTDLPNIIHETSRSTNATSVISDKDTHTLSFRNTENLSEKKKQNHEENLKQKVPRTPVRKSTSNRLPAVSDEILLISPFSGSSSVPANHFHDTMNDLNKRRGSVTPQSIVMNSSESDSSGPSHSRHQRSKAKRKSIALEGSEGAGKSGRTSPCLDFTIIDEVDESLHFKKPLPPKRKKFYLPDENMRYFESLKLPTDLVFKVERITKPDNKFLREDQKPKPKPRQPKPIVHEDNSETPDEILVYRKRALKRSVVGITDLEVAFTIISNAFKEFREEQTDSELIAMMEKYEDAVREDMTQMIKKAVSFSSKKSEVNKLERQVLNLAKEVGKAVDKRISYRAKLSEMMDGDREQTS